MNIQRRELKAVLALWLVLMIIATVAVLLLGRNAHRIIYHLEYVAVNRYQKAIALYTEAEKHTLTVLKKRQQLNAGTASPVAVQGNDAAVVAAEDLFQKAFEIDPRESFVPEQERHYTMYGDMLGASGQVDRQTVAYARAAIARRDFKTAEDYILKAAAASSATAELKDAADVQFAAAQLTYFNNRRDQVEAELNKAPQEQWTSPMHELRARVLLEAGNAAEAAVALEAALKKSSYPIDIRKRLAAAYSILQRPQDALKVMTEGRDQAATSDGNYMHILGDLLREHGDKREAVSVLEEAARLEPASGSIQLSLARAYQATNDRRRAARALQRASALEPTIQADLLK